MADVENNITIDKLTEKGPYECLTEFLHKQDILDKVYKYRNYSLIPSLLLEKYQIFFKDLDSNNNNNIKKYRNFFLKRIIIHGNLVNVLRDYFLIFTYLDEDEGETSNFKFTIQFGSHFIVYPSFYTSYQKIYEIIVHNAMSGELACIAEVVDSLRK